jgi:CxxC-x17-CxxC domain-containing protein
MGNFDRNDRGGNRGGGFGGGNRGGNRSFGGGNRGPATMHKAVCDECHKSCEVPFRPSGDKPIYCNECFGGKKEGTNRNDRGDRKDFGNFKPRRDFEDRGPKPFVNNNSSSNGGEDIKKQLSEMNNKLDRLINAMEKLSTPKVSDVKVSAPKIEVKKVEAKTQAKPKAKVQAKKIVSKKKK